MARKRAIFTVRCGFFSNSVNRVNAATQQINDLGISIEVFSQGTSGTIIVEGDERDIKIATSLLETAMA